MTKDIYQVLKKVKQENDLHSEIYSLFKVEEGGKTHVYMGVMSSDIQYYKHAYISHPKELLMFYDVGR